MYEQSLAISREAQDPDAVHVSLHQLGSLSLEQGDLGRARHLFVEALKTAQSCGNRMNVARSLAQFARLKRLAGDLAAARTLLQRALTVLGETDATDVRAMVSEDLAAVEAQARRARSAAGGLIENALPRLRRILKSAARGRERRGRAAE